MDDILLNMDVRSHDPDITFTRVTKGLGSLSDIDSKQSNGKMHQSSYHHSIIIILWYYRGSSRYCPRIGLGSHFRLTRAVVDQRHLWHTALHLSVHFHVQGVGTKTKN